ncbi:MAG: chemotaxis protein CheW [Nannocystis sp.]|jgi:purine-binding chemotaxis protein CheW|nr:chemotaxis protein CheW [Nannocystis sp.]
MPAEPDDLWQALMRSGESVATDEDYEHGYKQREVRRDLRHYVSFRVGSEIYGLPIAEIEEITKSFQTTYVPRTAAFLLGIGNVRGRIIPVLDLGRRLGLAEQAYGRAARVLIVSFQGEPYGLLVHQVLEVVRIPPESMEERPGGISGRRAEYIRGLARHRGALIIILNLPEVLDPRDFLRLGADEERR